jgi:hypothetical protein
MDGHPTGAPVTSEPTDDLPFHYDAPPVEPDDRAPRKCRHPRYLRTKVDGLDTCSCGHEFDPIRQRRSKNNRARGNAEELTVARVVGGRKMGPVGLPWDVEMPGYARIQVRKYVRPESLRAICDELDRIGYGPEMPGYVWIEPGRGGRKVIVFDLASFAERHGIKVDAA